MQSTNKKLRIVLLCDNTLRELEYLLFLKKTLEENCQAQVYIIGSVAEQQRMYYLLFKIQPHIVFISQVVEESMRQLAAYIKNSGAMVFVLPSEILVIPALSWIIANSKSYYDFLIDGIFLPGRRMQKLFGHSDIAKHKLLVTGSPKIDVLVKTTGNEFSSRQKFLDYMKIPSYKKNIVIFTSFSIIPEKHIKKDPAFVGNKRKLLAGNMFARKTRQIYSLTINKLCKDFSEYNIILKPHPLEEDTFYEDIHQPNCYLIKNMSFYHFLDSIDLVIHWTSTTATECWIRGIKTIQYVPHKDSMIFLTEAWHGNPLVHSYSKLCKAIVKYMNSPLKKEYIQFQKQYLQANFFKTDGKSAERIAQIIRKQTANKKFTLKYTRASSLFCDLFMILGKIIGVSLSRKAVGMFFKDYNYHFAIQHYVYLE